MDSPIEDKIRRVISLRMQRGQRKALAKAAGHEDGTWVSNWLAGRQHHATVDELAKMLKEVKTSLVSVINAPGEDAIDWEVAGLMSKLDDEQKTIAKKLIAGLVRRELVVFSPQSNSAAEPHLDQVKRKVRGKP